MIVFTKGAQERIGGVRGWKRTDGFEGWQKDGKSNEWVVGMFFLIVSLWQL